MAAEEDVAEAVVVEVAADEEPKVKLNRKLVVAAAEPSPDTRERPIRISRLVHGTGAPCTSNSGRARTFVLSPQPAHGKMYLLQDHRNETGTSPRLTSNC